MSVQSVIRAATAVAAFAVASCTLNESPTEPVETGQADLAVAAANTWSTKAPLIAARRFMAAAAIGNNIYAVGGADARNYSTTTLQVYDITKNTWSTRKPLPSARAWTNGASVINGKLYVSGGYYNKSLFVYNPTTNSWSQKADMPRAGFYGAQAAINGLLYVYAAATAPYIGPQFWRYNLNTNRWASLPIPPGFIDHEFPVAGAIGGKFYLAGGTKMGDPTGSLQVYDPATNKWTNKASMPEPRSEAAGAVINGKLYVAGGQGTALLVYNSSTDTWTRKAAMAERHSDAGASAGGRFYVVGGQNSSQPTLRRVEAYTP
jgi:N-acetylneuraminic acid mutarotase